MTDRITVETTPFKAVGSKAETKAEITTRAARAIIDNELALREAKTSRLRQARLDSETELAIASASVKPSVKKRKMPTKSASTAAGLVKGDD